MRYRARLSSAVPKVTPEELRKRVAERIRETTKRKGLTLADLATRAGVSEAGLYLALSGKSGPSIDFVAKVAMALDVDPSALVKPQRKSRSSAT